MEELEFPEEIVFIQILSRLPVKSLLRCRASREVLRHEKLLHCYSKMYSMIRLCYDSSTNDYKVILRFVGLPGKPFEFSNLRKRCWTKVDDDVSSNYLAIWGRNKGAVMNGNQH
ncbi:hypothetical protein LguiB_026201 [Lonicera macranthoides]